jgi:transposase
LGNQSSVQANRRAALILEVLAGVRLPSEAAQALGVSVTHYYLLERKALGGLLTACEVQPKGRSGPTAQEQVKRLERELEQCRRACQRQAALVRATQRAVGLPATAATSDTANKTSRKKKTSGSSSGRRRRRRPAVRALRAAEALERNSSLSQESDELQPSSAGESIGCPGVAQEGP